MIRRNFRHAVLPIAIATAALFLGCADTVDDPDVPGTPRATGAASNSVSVELSEWAVKAPSDVDAGSVSFVTRNVGTTPHDLVLIRTDVAADRLAKTSAGQVDESKYTVVGRLAQLNAGQSQTLQAQLPADEYVLICNVVGHYDLGMRTGITAE